MPEWERFARTSSYLHGPVEGYSGSAILSLFVFSLFFVENYVGIYASNASSTEEDYVDEAFQRIWQASIRNSLKFDSTAAALRYQKSCLQGAVIDNLRAYSRSKEVPLTNPDSDMSYIQEPAIEDDYESNDVWEAIKDLLPNERERRLAYLLYINGLKARDIVRFCPQEFGDIQEVYRLTRNIVERLIRNRDQIRWRLG